MQAGGGGGLIWMKGFRAVLAPQQRGAVMPDSLVERLGQACDRNNLWIKGPPQQTPSNGPGEPLHVWPELPEAPAECDPHGPAVKLPSEVSQVNAC